jgi:AraC family transcriptional regulator, transcriptional activator of pobA
MFPTYNIGHFLNEPANPTAFEVLRFNDMAEPDVDDRHKHTFYEIIWVDAGQSQQTIDYQTYPLGPQSLFFISPGQLHEFEEWEPLAGGSILFTADFFLLNQAGQDKLFELSYLDNLHANPLLQPTPADFALMRQTIALIDIEHRRQPRTPAVLQALLHTLLAQIQRCVEEQPGRTQPSKRYVVLFKQFKQLLDAHFAESWTVSAYADRLNITQHHLNVVCQQVVAQSATQVIRARTMLEAKRLLTYTDVPIATIAEQLSYLDPSYFTRVFRAEVGSSPGTFRQVMSEKYQS